MGRVIATRNDLYGPGASTFGTLRTTEVNGPAVQDSTQSPTGAVSVTTLFSNWRASILGKPLTWLFGLIGTLVLFKLIEEKRGGREAFDEMKIGLNNLVKVTLMVMLGFALFRYGATRVNIPGLSPLVRYSTGGS